MFLCDDVTTTTPGPTTTTLGPEAITDVLLTVIRSHRGSNFTNTTESQLGMQHVHLGEDLILNCTSNFNQIPTRRYFWNRHSDVIESVAEEGSVSRLHTIRGFSESNAGVYSCSIEYSNGQVKYSPTVNVKVQSGPIMSSKFTKIPLGMLVKIECQPRHLGHNYYRIFQDDKEVQNGRRRKYKIKQFSNEHEGNYTCRSSNGEDGITESSEPVMLTTIPRNSVCKCKCPKHILELSRVTDTELFQKVEEIKKELIIPKRNISANIRKKTCAVSRVKSSLYIGTAIGIPIFIIVFAPFVMLDAATLVSHLWSKHVRRPS